MIQASVLMVLGAQRSEVIALIIRESLRLIPVGLVCGFGAAALTTRYLQDLLVGLTPLDLTTFGAVAAVLTVVTIVASYLPVRRVSFVDPLVALRYE